MTEVLYEVADHVATITLNAPERMNTISGPMLRAISERLLEADRDPRRALHRAHRRRPGVLRRARPAGADGGTQGWSRQPRRPASRSPASSTCATPRRSCCTTSTRPRSARSTAARPATASTSRSAATSASPRTSAKLNPGFAKRGILPESGGTWLLPRMVGYAKAAEIAFTGRTLTADEALELGLVNHVVADRRAGQARRRAGRRDRRERAARRAGDQADDAGRRDRDVRAERPPRVPAAAAAAAAPTTSARASPRSWRSGPPSSPAAERRVDRASAAADPVSLLEGLATTRAIRRYTADPIPDADLAAILWHAGRAPIGSNRQPFRFLVLRDGPKARDGQVAARARRSAPLGGKIAATATRRLRRRSVVAEGAHGGDDAALRRPLRARSRWSSWCASSATARRRPYEGASVYPACQNLLLAARALGYGGALTVWHHGVEAELRDACSASPTTSRCRRASRSASRPATTAR